MEIGEKVWNIASAWGYFEKDTIGKQLVRAADSISANISEGFGRYHYKDSKNFGYYARGSLFETRSWIKKAYTRMLITEKDYGNLIGEIEIIGASLNKLINSTGKSSSK